MIDSNFATETRIHSSKYPLKHWGLWVHRCNERRSARSRRGPVFAANRHRPASSPQPDDLVEMVFVRPVNGTRRRSRSLQWQWALCRRLRPPRRAPPAPADFQAPGTAGCATRSTGTGSLLDHDAFDFVERDRVRRPVVELRRLRRRMPGDPLGVLRASRRAAVRRNHARLVPSTTWSSVGEPPLGPVASPGSVSPRYPDSRAGPGRRTRQPSSRTAAPATRRPAA